MSTVVLVVGLGPWLDHRVAMPMDQMARVYSRYPNVVVYYIDPNWAVTPGARWRLATEPSNPARCWVLRPAPEGEPVPDPSRAVFVDVTGRAVAGAALVDALDAADRVVCLAHSFWPDMCRRLVETLQPDALIYDCHETVVKLASASSEGAAHAWLVDRADVVLAISPAVAQAVEGLGRTPMLLGNGIEVERFGAAVPAESDWTFGLLSAFSDWVDVPALHALADAFPGESLALVGPVHRSMGRAYEALASRPNVIAHPGVPHADVPATLQRMEVCLLPRLLTPVSMACDPLKLYEYLAAGRPVVSTRVPSAVALADVVYLADGGTNFGAGAERALGDVRAGRFDASRVAAGRAAVMGRTWDARCAAAWRAVSG